MKTAILAAIFAVCSNVVFAAQCGGTADFYGLLADKYDEQMVWTGILDNGNVVSLWMSTETETWTLVVTDGEVTCMMASGVGFAPVPQGEAL